MSSSMLREGKDFLNEPPRISSTTENLLKLKFKSIGGWEGEKMELRFKKVLKFYLEFMNELFPSEKEREAEAKMSLAMPLEVNELQNEPFVPESSFSLMD